jgi:hypothetical protein
MRKKQLLIPVSLALHTKLKFKAKSDGLSMSEAVRRLIVEYVGGDVEVTAPPDIYDQLAEKAAAL